MLLKKITGWIVLQYKIIITKYQNIAINSFSIKHEHAHEVVVKNVGCFTYKDNLVFENYLNILNDKDNLTLSKFRTTNHKLPVENGRWKNSQRE